jgi:hypothetical protein
MWTAFSKAADEAIKGGRLEHGKVLWLLADACSMMLESNNFNNPFKPAMVFGEKRSAIPQDFTDDDILFFSQIVGDIDNDLLKGRISDIAWLMNRSLGVNFALTAIDSYRNIPLDTMTMVRVGKDCWGRAITLSKVLRAGAGDRINQIEDTIFDALVNAKAEDGFLGIWLANLLIDNNIAKQKLAEIADIIENLSKEFEQADDNYQAQEYANVAAKAYSILNNPEKMAEMMACQAECIVKDASKSPSRITAIHFYEKAIQIYRMIPKTERVMFDGDNRISKLRDLLTDEGNVALGEMHLVKTEGIDISKIIESSERQIRGKNTQEALLSFANLNNFANADEIRKRAIEQINLSPLHVLFPATVISRDGRAIAKQPGLNLNNTDGNEQIIFSEMIKNYLIQIGLVVEAKIIPAMHILFLEHYFCEQDIYSIVKQSPIVPIGRELFITKALYSGFQYEFVTCLHLLIPQIENLVRFHLKKAGAKTTNLDASGIEHENGLSSLVELPEMKDIFGNNLTFELKALLCSSFGPNLRNEAAHGLLEQNQCYSNHSIYAWWLLFRIIFNTFWNIKNNTAIEQNSDEST